MWLNILISLACWHFAIGLILALSIVKEYAVEIRDWPFPRYEYHREWRWTKKRQDILMAIFAWEYLLLLMAFFFLLREYERRIEGLSTEAQGQDDAVKCQSSNGTYIDDHGYERCADCDCYPYIALPFPCQAEFNREQKENGHNYDGGIMRRYRKSLMRKAYMLTRNLLGRTVG